MAIVFRNTKGSALTHAELDGNFSDLNSRIRDSSAIVSLIETNSIDSAKANNLINATLVTTIDNRIATKSTDDLSEGASNLYFTNARAQAVSIDSAEAIQLIDSAYVQARQATADTGITVQEEGVSLSNAGTTLNFVGSNVTASGTGAIKTITITDAAGIDSAAAIQAVTSDNLNMGSNNITTTGKILFANVYNDSSDLPNATTYHGMFAHVHNTGAGYFAHAGNWIRLANKGEIGIDSAATTALIDSAYVLARAPAQDFLDSTEAIALIDSAYVLARAPAQDFLDSSETIALIQNTVDSSYVALREANIAANPAGSSTQVQFNDGGSFAGDAGLVYSKDSDKLTAVNLTVTNITTTGSGSTTVTAGANIELNATNRVLVTDTPFRLASMTTTQRNAIASPVNGDMIYNSTIGQYEIYQRSAWHPLTKGTAIFNVVNNGASDYTFTDAETHWFPTSENDPVLYLRRGETYYFIVNASGHPFEIRVSNGGSAYSTGVTNNAAATGTIVFKVPMSAPATLYYQCTVHSGMGNTINIV